MIVSSAAKADFKPVHMPLNLNESANVDRFSKLFRDRYMFVPGMGWYAWDGVCWREDVLGSAYSDTQAVATVLDKELDDFFNSKTGLEMEEEDATRLRKTVAAFRTKTLGVRTRQGVLDAAEKEMGHAAEELNADRWSLVVRNGTLDLRTGELRNSSPGDLNTQCAAVDYVPEAACPGFDALLEYAFDGDKEMISYIWRVLGYTLTGSTAEQSFFFLWGVRGSGKTTICEIMSAVLGDYALLLDEEALFGAGQHPTWIADLLGKRLIFKDELNQKRRMNTALVNTLVSGGKMRGRRMRKDFASIPVHGKLFIATNHRPPMGNAQDGVFRRLKPVWFSRPVSDADKVLDYAVRLAEQEGSGILWKALEGLRDYLGAGEGAKPSLRTPKQVIADAQEYQDSEDEIGPFITDHLVKVEDGEDWVSTEDLYQLYKRWCETGGIKPVSINELNKHLKEQGFKQFKPIKAKNAVTNAKVTKRGYINMKLDVEDGSAVVWRPVADVKALL